MESIIRYIEENREKFINELIEFLKIPSISSDSNYKKDVLRCADFLAEQMQIIGLKNVQILPTGGYPVVYSEYIIDPNKPAFLIYGHYDVQPVDPLELWETPPFEPSIRDGEIYARGASDDKGQIYDHLKAIEAHLKVKGTLPVNIKMMIEGEEEIGSANLNNFIEQHKSLLKNEATIISDTSIFAKGVPSICVGLRGICYMEITIKGPDHDLHSGGYGGAVANPLNVLAEIIASLKDKNGKVTIPGFYDSVYELSEKERKDFASLPFDEEDFKRSTGVKILTGESNYSTLERLWIRPTLDVNGIWGGYCKEGTKTIIPSYGKAKISMRLVPNQEPKEIAKLFKNYIEKITPPTVSVEIKEYHGAKPFLTSTNHPAFQAVMNSMEKVYGKKPLITRGGGTIGFVPEIAQRLKTQCILMGLSLPNENIHAPNERFNIENYFLGIKSAAYLYDELSKL